MPVDVPLIEVRCPNCSKPCRIDEKSWNRLVPGFLHSCSYCYQQPPVTEWQRSYERQELAKAGFITPRMQRDQEQGRNTA